MIILRILCNRCVGHMNELVFGYAAEHVRIGPSKACWDSVNLRIRDLVRGREPCLLSHSWSVYFSSSQACIDMTWQGFVYEWQIGCE